MNIAFKQLFNRKIIHFVHIRSESKFILPLITNLDRFRFTSQRIVDVTIFKVHRGKIFS